MPFEISKYAKGMPSILGLKERGLGLPAMADQLVSVFDARDLYLLDQREFAAFTNVSPTGGPLAFSDGIVPAGELWYVWNFQIGCQPGAGVAITMAPAIYFDANPNASVVGDFIDVPANQNAQAVTRRPHWCGPGTRFAVYAKTVTLAPSVSGGVVVTRLKV